MMEFLSVQGIEKIDTRLTLTNFREIVGRLRPLEGRGLKRISCQCRFYAGALRPNTGLGVWDLSRTIASSSSLSPQAP